MAGELLLMATIRTDSAVDKRLSRAAAMPVGRLPTKWTRVNNPSGPFHCAAGAKTSSS